MLTSANIVPKMERQFLKRVVCFSIVFFLMICCSNEVFSQNGTYIRTVVIDAGHGGKDPGAVGKHSREKDITLKVALKLGNYIKKNLPDVKVIYTRKTDKFVELKKRGEIANKNNADVFISIHCNANKVSSLYGAETYVLGSDPKRTNRNMKVAMLENAAILLEENSEENYNGFNPNSPQSYIIFSLKQNAYKEEKSLDLAEKIQKQFKERVGRKDRSVHQAGFLVLAGTYMPSVLVELGYLTNPKEEKFLLSEKGQVYLASAIYRAFKEYKREFEKENKAYEYRRRTLKKENETVSKQTSNKKKTSTEGVEYRVQFYANTKKIPLSSPRFSKLKEVDYYYHNGLYKYTTGHFNNKQDAVMYKTKVRRLGFNDAFVAAFYKGKRISIQEAEKLTNR